MVVGFHHDLYIVRTVVEVLEVSLVVVVIFVVAKGGQWSWSSRRFPSRWSICTRELLGISDYGGASLSITLRYEGCTFATLFSGI